VLTKSVPLSHVTGAAGLAVRFIGGNAEALTKQVRIASALLVTFTSTVVN